MGIHVPDHPLALPPCKRTMRLIIEMSAGLASKSPWKGNAMDPHGLPLRSRSRRDQGCLEVIYPRTLDVLAIEYQSVGMAVETVDNYKYNKKKRREFKTLLFCYQLNIYLRLQNIPERLSRIHPGHLLIQTWSALHLPWEGCLPAWIRSPLLTQRTGISCLRHIPSSSCWMCRSCYTERYNKCCTRNYLPQGMFYPRQIRR